MLFTTRYTIGYEITNWTAYAALMSSEQAQARDLLMGQMESVLLVMRSRNAPEPSGVQGVDLPAGFTAGAQVRKGEHVWIDGKLICDEVFELLENGVHATGTATVAGTTVKANYFLHVYEHH